MIDDVDRRTPGGAVIHINSGLGRSHGQRGVSPHAIRRREKGIPAVSIGLIAPVVPEIVGNIVKIKAGGGPGAAPVEDDAGITHLGPIALEPALESDCICIEIQGRNGHRPVGPAGFEDGVGGLKSRKCWAVEIDGGCAPILVAAVYSRAKSATVGRNGIDVRRLVQAPITDGTGREDLRGVARGIGGRSLIMCLDIVGGQGRSVNGDFVHSAILGKAGVVSRADANRLGDIGGEGAAPRRTARLLTINVKEDMDAIYNADHMGPVCRQQPGGADSR